MAPTVTLSPFRPMDTFTNMMKPPYDVMTYEAPKAPEANQELPCHPESPSPEGFRNPEMELGIPVKEPRTSPVEEPRTPVEEPRTPVEEPRTPAEEPRNPQKPRPNATLVKLGYLGINEKPEEL